MQGVTRSKCLDKKLLVVTPQSLLRINMFCNPLHFQKFLGIMKGCPALNQKVPAGSQPRTPPNTTPTVPTDEDEDEYGEMDDGFEYAKNLKEDDGAADHIDMVGMEDENEEEQDEDLVEEDECKVLTYVVN